MKNNNEIETKELRKICWLKLETELIEKLSKIRNKILNIYGIKENNKK